MNKIALAIVSVLFFATPCVAETAFQFNSPLLQVPDDSNVSGMRLSMFYGKTPNVSGFDAGMVSFSQTGNSSGFAAILGLHRVTGRSTGLQSALINVHSGESAGVNAAFVNAIQSAGSGGVNIGFVNVTKGASNIEISGLAISDSAQVQVGFVNVTKRIKGVQIGFLNFAENGFLPVFPIFNFPKK